MFNQVLATVSEGELGIGDRNICTVGFLWGLHRKGARNVIREHKSMPWKALTTSLQANGSVFKGELFEQTVQITLLFQTVTENYECEIQTLGYPKAALFSFCLAISSLQHFGNRPRCPW